MIEPALFTVIIDGVSDVRGGLFGHVFVAFVQGVVAGLGLAVAGVPNPVGYLYLTGEPAFAVGLLVYSVLVVGLTDDYLRPFAVNRYAELNPAVILLGILGGGYAFGVIGLFSALSFSAHSKRRSRYL